MRFDDLLDEQSAQCFGFAWLRSAVAPVSPYGARAFATLRPYRRGEEAAALERAQELHRRAEAISPERIAATLSAIAALPDVDGIVARASIGEALADPDFYDLLRFCDGIEALDTVGNPATRAVKSALSPGRYDADAFYLADSFDGALNETRRAMGVAQAEFEAVRGRERAATAHALGREEIPGDEFIVMRADLRDGLPPGVRVTREAATYVSCVLECGEAALRALERRDSAIAAVAAAEARAREHLSATVRENAAGLHGATAALATLDVTLAAVRYAQRHNCTAPDFSADASLAIASGRFLPLEEQLRHVGRAFVPIDLVLNGPAALTGPNMGGKTVAMQTCGFIALAAAFGLPVPARNARLALFDRVAWLGVGRDDGRDELLSSFAAEIVALKAVFDSGPQRRAIFIDEFARTTSPAEGIALTVALLERLRDVGACGLAATHLPGIAKAAQVPHFAVREYRISEVDAGDDLPGEAIELAQTLGMDEEFVAAARRALKGTAWIR